MKKLILVCFILFFCNFEVNAQFTPVDWNNTLLDESLIDCSYNSSSGNFLLNTVRGHPSFYPNNYSYIFDYNHILYLTDSSFNLIDSIYLDGHGKYGLAITKILKTTSESIIVIGPALDTTTYLYDAIIIW